MATKQEILLRVLEETDLERTHKWHNDSTLYENLGDAFRPVSKSADMEWLRKKSAYSINEANFAICLGKGGEHIGNIYLREIDWIARKAALHIFIGNSKHRGKGIGEEAIRQMLNHAFNDLNLNRVFLEVFPDNKPAVRVYEKCGFKTEGSLRQNAFKNGVYKDMLIMGICASDFSQ